MDYERTKFFGLLEHSILSKCSVSHFLITTTFSVVNDVQVREKQFFKNSVSLFWYLTECIWVFIGKASLQKNVKISPRKFIFYLLNFNLLQ